MRRCSRGRAVAEENIKLGGWMAAETRFSEYSEACKLPALPENDHWASVASYVRHGHISVEHEQCYQRLEDEWNEGLHALRPFTVLRLAMAPRDYNSREELAELVVVV